MKSNIPQRVSDGQRVGWFALHTDAYVGARSRAVVFIPWDARQGAEWITKTDNWNLARPDKFQIVTYQDGTKDVRLQQITQDPQGVVYIRGHGNPGAPYIMSNYQTAKFKTTVGLVLTITDACERLIQSGLGAGFSGAIKFYSCYSGTKFAPQALENANATLTGSKARSQNWVAAMNAELSNTPKAPENSAKRNAAKEEKLRHEENLKKGPAQDKSMARQGADYLRSRGFKTCAFYGYLGPLGSTYELDSDPDRTRVHKRVELEGLQNAPAELGRTARPSVARVRV